MNLLAMLRRWWALLLLGGVLAGVAGYFGASRSAPKYSATVKLLVGPINTDFDTLRAAGQLARTYADLATSGPVLRYAIDTTGVRVTSRSLQDSGAVSSQSNDVTRIVSINVELGNARVAAAMANAIAQRIRTLVAVAPPQQTTAIAKLLSQPEVGGLSRGQQAGVTAAVRRVLGGSLAGSAEVVDPAEVPREPVSPRINLITALAALMGLLAVGVAVMVRESSLQRVADERSLAALGEPPFLGEFRLASSWRGVAPLAIDAGPDDAVESFRAIVTKVGFLDDQPRVHTLLVLDAGDGRPGGGLAANLATVLADAQRQVILLDAGVARGGATAALGLDGRPGYGELLSGLREAGLNGRIEPFRVRQSPTLDVLPRGATSATGTLDEDRAARLLALLERDADFVIISVAPVHISPAALVWARVADGTLLAVDAGRTSQERVVEAIRSLRFVDASIIGTALGRQRGLRFGFRQHRASETVVAAQAIGRSEPGVDRPGARND